MKMLYDAFAEKAKKFGIDSITGPLEIDLLPTNQCNQSCIYCHLRDNKTSPEGELTEEEIVRMVVESAEMGVKYWSIIGGGEPFFTKEKTLAAMREIKKRRIHGSIVTNGSLLTHDIIKEIIRIKWDSISISIDSADPAVQDAIRGYPGALEKAKKALELIKKEKKGWMMWRSNPKVVFNTVLTNRNYAGLGELFILAKEMGASVVHITLVIIINERTRELRLNPAQIAGFRAQIPYLEALAKKLGIYTNVSSYLEPGILEEPEAMGKQLSQRNVNAEKKQRLSQISCYNPWMRMIIMTGGDVGPCCFYTQDKKVGNIRESSLKSIWEGEQFSEFRRKIAEGEDVASCADCPASEILSNDRIRQKLAMYEAKKSGRKHKKSD